MSNDRGKSEMEKTINLKKNLLVLYSKKNK